MRLNIGQFNARHATPKRRDHDVCLWPFQSTFPCSAAPFVREQECCDQIEPHRQRPTGLRQASWQDLKARQERQLEATQWGFAIFILGEKGAVHGWGCRVKTIRSLEFGVVWHPWPNSPAGRALLYRWRSTLGQFKLQFLTADWMSFSSGWMGHYNVGDVLGWSRVIPWIRFVSFATIFEWVSCAWPSRCCAFRSLSSWLQRRLPVAINKAFFSWCGATCRSCCAL